MQMIDKKLDQELIAFIYGWDEMEVREHGNKIIDMNLSPCASPKRYRTRKAVLADVEMCLSLPEVKNHELICRKLNAHKYYLGMLINGDIPYDEYAENTMGIKPALFSENKIATIKNRVIKGLDNVGVKFDHNIRENLNRLENEAQPSGDMVTLLESSHQSFYTKLNQKLQLDVDLNINYSALPEDHSFLFWTSGDGKDFKIEYHPTRSASMRRSKVELFSAHEATAHAVQAAALRKKIEVGQMPQYLGCITTHEPVQFGFEGLALTLPLFYPEEFQMNKFHLLSLDLARLDYAVINNARVRACHGENRGECLDYLAENANMLWDEAKGIFKKSVDDKVDGWGYSQVYSQAWEAFEENRNHVDRDQFIKSVYLDFLMPEQIIDQNKVPHLEYV